MKCPFCDVVETKVVDSRLNQIGDVVRRRRECPKCEARFTTYERVEELLPVIVKKDGRRESFSREKVIAGLEKACQKRPIQSEALEQMVRRVENRIQAMGIKEVASRVVGEMLIRELHALDQVAYVRFASVYREFRDVQDFLAELREPPTARRDEETLGLGFGEET